MNKRIEATDVKTRQINPLFIKQTVCADYNLNGLGGYGRISQLRKKQGILEGKLLGSGRWARIKAIYCAD